MTTSLFSVCDVLREYNKKDIHLSNSTTITLNVKLNLKKAFALCVNVCNDLYLDEEFKSNSHRFTTTKHLVEFMESIDVDY